MKNPLSIAKYYVWVYASDGNVYSIIPFEKKKDAEKRHKLLTMSNFSCSVETELPCEWVEAGVDISL
jgi:hypothetical protein